MGEVAVGEGGDTGEVRRQVVGEVGREGADPDDPQRAQGLVSATQDRTQVDLGRRRDRDAGGTTLDRQ